jgi:hypothetical protein
MRKRGGSAQHNSIDLMVATNIKAALMAAVLIQNF